jgi:hypothetical protein
MHINKIQDRHFLSIKKSMLPFVGGGALEYRGWGYFGKRNVTRTLQAKVWLNDASMIIHLRVDGERWNEALIRGVYLGCFKHFPFFINIWKFFVQIDFGCSRYSGLILVRVVAVCSNARI